MTALLNQARAAQALKPLTVSSDLVAVARAQAQRMAAAGTLFHNPNLSKQVRSYRWAGENVGYGPVDPAVVHNAFMASQAHRANILDADFTQVGVGAVTSDGRLWVVEVFRQPR